MNVLPLVVLWLLGKRDGGDPSWPSSAHPPPRRARHAPEPPHGHAPPVHHEGQHAATQHTAEHHQAHAEHHDSAPHSASHPHAAPQYSNLDFGHNAPAHHDAPHHDAPHGQQYTSLDFSHAKPREDAAPPAVHHDAPPAPAAAPAEGEYSIRALQRILVGLGWRGHLTTQGALSPLLQDGLYGPVTHDDWQQSASKRHLDSTFIRLGPETAHVDPATYRQLRAIAAQSGAVVGIGGGQFIRIP